MEERLKLYLKKKNVNSIITAPAVFMYTRIGNQKNINFSY